jgi:hypothetical protein
MGNPRKEELILNKARDKWIDSMINEYADIDKTVGKGSSPEEVRKWFEYAYKSITDNHNVEKTPSSIIDRYTKGRKIIPRNEEAQIANIRKYGLGTLKDTISHTIRSTATDLTLLRMFGPEPYKMIDTIASDAFAVAKADGTEFFKKDLESVKANGRIILSVVDGSAFDNSSRAAKIGGALRTYNTVKLIPNTFLMGGILDQAAVASQMNTFGIPYYKSIAKISSNLVKDIKPSEYRKMLGDVLQVYINTGTGSIARLTGMGYGETMSRTGKFFSNMASKLSMHPKMTFSKELSCGGGMSEILVQHKHLTFKGLPEHLSSTMKLYDITPEMWDLARKNTTHVPKAGEFIGSDVFTHTSDTAIREYLGKIGIDAKNYNGTSLGRVRDDISHKWSTYIRDQISHGVMTPDAASRAF